RSQPEVVVLRVVPADERAVGAERGRDVGSALLPPDPDHLADVRLDTRDADAAAVDLAVAGADARHLERSRHLLDGVLGRDAGGRGAALPRGRVVTAELVGG